MKKLSIILLVFVLIFVLAACGRKKDDKTDSSSHLTTVPATENTHHETNPTMDTNIPDDHVEGAVPDGTDGMDDTLDGMTGDINGSTGNNAMGGAGSNTANP